jgi:GT2 family glycosyltransferase
VSISVIVCTRNRPALLARCLERIARLDPRPEETIVVDQSDAEAGRGVTERFLRSIPGLRYHPSASRGASRARNAGLRLVRGDVVAFTDDDCLVRSDWAGALARIFAERADLAGVTGGSVVGEEDASDARVRAACTWHPASPRTFRGVCDPARVGASFNMAFRKEWIERVGGFEPDLGPGAKYRGAEDADFLHRVLRSGGVIRYDPDVVVSHLPWRSGQDQSAVEFDYGYGLAAWALVRMTRGDFHPARIAASAFLAQSRRAASGWLRRDARARATGASYCAGFLHGAIGWIRSPRGGNGIGPGEEVRDA